jgi:hypothetical protein
MGTINMYNGMLISGISILPLFTEGRENTFLALSLSL